MTTYIINATGDKLTSRGMKWRLINNKQKNIGELVGQQMEGFL